MLTLEEIVDNFEFLDDWNDRYRYLIELGRALDPLAEQAHSEPNRVRGCASQVWLETRVEGEGESAILRFKGDSDAFIVKGLIYLVLALYDNRSASEIGQIEPAELFKRLDLAEHLTPQRSNGLRAMIERIKTDAHHVAKAERTGAA